MGDSKQILISSKDFFKDVVDDAFKHRRIKTFPLAQQYIAHLLENYISADKLFDESSEDGKKSRKTLAELFLTASSSDSAVRNDLLKRLGDSSLYVSGFFGESLQRKVVDIDYYANMGGLAYGSLSNLVKEDTYRKVYQEISTRFMDFVDILTFVSQKVMVQSDENLLRLYDKYIRTGSELAKDTLLEKGINPVPKTTKAYNQ